MIATPRQAMQTDFERLDGGVNLAALDLAENPEIDDQAAPLLARHAHLKRLNLAGTQFSDEGVVELANLKGLKSLDLAGTGVTNVTFELLLWLPALAELHLENTACTVWGAAAHAEARAERSLPQVRVMLGWRETPRPATPV